MADKYGGDTRGKPPKGKPPKDKPPKDKNPNKNPNAPGPRQTGRETVEAGRSGAARRVGNYEREMLQWLAQLRNLGSRNYMNQQLRLARQMWPQMGQGAFMGQGAMRRSARADVNAIINPQLEAIRKLYGRRSDDMAQAYGHYFGETGPQIAAYADQLADNQNRISADQQASNAAMAAFLQGRGQELAGGVGDAMAAINAPQGTLDATSGSLQGLASGTAGQTYALGGAATDLLRAQEQAANTMAGLTPIRAQQQGMEQLGAGQRMLTNQMGEDIDAIQARVPELAYNVLQDYRTQNQANRQLQAQRANAILGFLGDAGTQRFNYLTAGSAILRDLLQGAQASELGYAGLGPDYMPPTPTSGDGTTADDAQERLGERKLDVRTRIRDHTFFLQAENPLKPGTLRPSGAMRNPRRAAIIIANAIKAEFPNWTPQQIREFRNIILRERGIRIPQSAGKGPTKPTKPKPQQPPPSTSGGGGGGGGTGGGGGGW